MDNVSASWVCSTLGTPKVLMSFTKSDALLTYSLAVGLEQVNLCLGRRADVKLEVQGSGHWLALFGGESTRPLYTLWLFPP